MLTYDVDLFYNFLSTRHKKKTAKWLTAAV
jgi:hypothetical protein